MTRDETVALFLECEAKRAEAHAAALTEGKPDYDAIAHEAGKAHWNTGLMPFLPSAKRWKRTDAGLRARQIGAWTPKPISASASFSTM